MIRYYKGKQKVIRLTKRSPLGTALYEILGVGPLGNVGEKTVFLVSLGHKKPRMILTFSIVDGVSKAELNKEFMDYICDQIKDEPDYDIEVKGYEDTSLFTYFEKHFDLSESILFQPISMTSKTTHPIFEDSGEELEELKEEE